MLRRAALLCALLAAAAGLGMAVSRILPRGDQILFERDVLGIRDLWLLDVPRALSVRLTRTRYITEEHAAWSPDGERFAYAVGPPDGLRRVCVRRVVPAAPRCYAPAALWDDTPVWLPDGGGLLIESIDEQYGGELYHLTEDGARMLTRAMGNDTHHALGPDGRTVLFTSTRDGLRQLYMVRLDGDGLARLSDGAANEGRPFWSPDGQSIVFISDRALTEDLYLMPTACLSQPETCAAQSVRLTTHEALLTDVTWSPDGERLAFIANPDGDFEVYMVDITTGEETRWGASPNIEEDPRFSPDGQKLAFVSRRAGRFAVYVQPLMPGAPPQRITFDAADHWAPQWRP